MDEPRLLILLAALGADWVFGDPHTLWRRTGHPVAWMGKLIEVLDRRLNVPGASADRAIRNGAIAWVVMIAVAVVLAVMIVALLAKLWPLGLLAEGFIVFALLAQKSLKDHVAAVANGLRAEGVTVGRKAIAAIVGRDPQSLDREGVSRAAIESLAENFSDGVVAPAFWYAVFGLPGIVAYKMINTADSMIGHRSEKYRNFGRVAARADDLANWIPARLSAILIALAASVSIAPAAGRAAIGAALRDAGLHRSPNAGWPEAAMAGALGIALGGPRAYRDGAVQQAYLNSAGIKKVGESEIDRALRLFAISCFVGWAVVLILLVI
jgi:adenosylcobinamide-phosphate synthase